MDGAFVGFRPPGSSSWQSPARKRLLRNQTRPGFGGGSSRSPLWQEQERTAAEVPGPGAYRTRRRRAKAVDAGTGFPDKPGRGFLAAGTELRRSHLYTAACSDPEMHESATFHPGLLPSPADHTERGTARDAFPLAPELLDWEEGRRSGTAARARQQARAQAAGSGGGGGGEGAAVTAGTAGEGARRQRRRQRRRKVVSAQLSGRPRSPLFSRETRRAAATPAGLLGREGLERAERVLAGGFVRAMTAGRADGGGVCGGARPTHAVSIPCFEAASDRQTAIDELQRRAARLGTPGPGHSQPQRTAAGRKKLKNAVGYTAFDSPGGKISNAHVPNVFEAAAAAEKRMGNDLGPASLQARTSFTPKDGVKISSAVMLPLDFFEMKEAKQKPSATAYEVDPSCLRTDSHNEWTRQEQRAKAQFLAQARAELAARRRHAKLAQQAGVAVRNAAEAMRELQADGEGGEGDFFDLAPSDEDEVVDDEAAAAARAGRAAAEAGALMEEEISDDDDDAAAGFEPLVTTFKT